VGKLRRLHIEVIFTDEKSVAHGWAYYYGQTPAKVELGVTEGDAMIYDRSLAMAPGINGLVIQDLIDPLGWLALEQLRGDGDE
jgi:hypothetical protein